MATLLHNHKTNPILNSSAIPLHPLSTASNPVLHTQVHNLHQTSQESPWSHPNNTSTGDSYSFSYPPNYASTVLPTLKHTTLLVSLEYLNDS